MYKYDPIQEVIRQEKACVIETAARIAKWLDDNKLKGRIKLRRTFTLPDTDNDFFFGYKVIWHD